MNSQYQNMPSESGNVGKTSSYGSVQQSLYYVWRDYQIQM